MLFPPRLTRVWDETPFRCSRRHFQITPSVFTADFSLRKMVWGWLAVSLSASAPPASESLSLLPFFLPFSLSFQLPSLSSWVIFSRHTLTLIVKLSINSYNFTDSGRCPSPVKKQTHTHTHTHTHIYIYLPLPECLFGILK